MKFFCFFQILKLAAGDDDEDEEVESTPGREAFKTGEGDFLIGLGETLEG